MKSKYLIVVFIVVFHWCNMDCQGIDFGASAAYLTITEGLSHSTVHCLLEDTHGYVWVGTQYGLDKYDGYDCLRVEGEVQGSLLDSKITALYEDSKGSIWVGTAESGIYVQASQSDVLKHISPVELFGWARLYEITSLYEDSEGFVWVTSSGGGVTRFHPETGKSFVYNQSNSGLSRNVAFDVVEDANGVIWVATSGPGLNKLAENGCFEMSKEPIEGTPNMNGYRKKLLLVGDDLWIATQGTGLYRMDIRDESHVRFSPDLGGGGLNSNMVMDILQLNDGSLCVATDGGGLNLFVPDSSSVEQYSVSCFQAEKLGLQTNALYSLMEDHSGNIWIGSYNGGVTIYKSEGPLFDTYAPGFPGCDEMQSQSVLAITQTNDGFLWIGTDAGGLNRVFPEDMDFDEPAFVHHPDDSTSLAGNVVKTLFEDCQHRLWIGMFWAGLDIFDSESSSFEHVLSEPYSVWSLTERPDGSLWAGTMGQGIVKIDPFTFEWETHIHQPNVPGGLADNNVMVVCAQGPDRVWVGTADRGLDCWVERTGEFEHHRHDPSIPSSISDDQIRCLFLTRGGELWIGTERGGLNKWLGNGKFQRIGRDDGLIGNGIMGITEDTSGRLWITTIEGISRMHPVTLEIQNYDFRSAEIANQFNQDAILSTTENELYFGGIYGLNSIQGETPFLAPLEGRLLITRFEVFDDMIRAGQKRNGHAVLDVPIEDATDIHLSARDNSIAFEFVAMRAGNLDGLRYAFMLEGFDDRWMYTKMGEHRASYTNLDPGDYVFRVICRNLETSIRVLISPPFWRTWWFFSLGIVTLCSSLGAGLKLIKRRRDEVQTRSLLQKKNEKLKAEAEGTKSKLLLSATQIIRNNDFLLSIRKGLNDLRQQKDVTPEVLIHLVNSELRNQHTWKEFETYLQEFDQKFLQTLLQIHPELTANDIRLFSLIRMNMTTKEISFLFNISGRAVEQARYRLKKRLNLDKKTDLNSYILTFQTED